MKQAAQRKARPRRVAIKAGLAKCSPDEHHWEVFDNFPGHEIYECGLCKKKKFVETKSGCE